MEKTLRLSAEQRDDLVAYLDGELPDATAQQIDQVLARSEVARHEVEALARTWEMLDVLPTPKAPPEFTKRTMTTLTTAEIPYNLSDQPWFVYVRRSATVAVWAIALGASGWLGYQVTNNWIDNPHKQMLQDLPTLQKLDTYEEVESIDFLNKLQNSRVFDSEKN
jgi:anti-sigma factor RsiW